MADFHQPRYVPTLHALGRHHLLGAHAADQVVTRARTAGVSTTLILPALAQELGTLAFPRILRLLAADALVGRLMVVLGRATPAQHEAAERLLQQVRIPVSLVRLDDPAVAAITRSLARQGVEIAPHGKGHACWVGICTALAGTGSDVIAMHDCDIETYSPALLRRLLSPLVTPARPFDFAKGYYPRVTTRLYGRVTRLFVAPLLRALHVMDLPTRLTAFLSDFRYPLAGEVALSRALAADLPMHTGWGLEIGTLVEVYQRQATCRVCQVDIAETYDHRHRPIDGVDADFTGLTTMVGQIAGTLMQGLRRDGIVVDGRLLRYVLVHHRHEAQRLLDIYEADAAINGLAYERAREADTVEQLAAAFERWIASGCSIAPPALPSWNDVRALAPSAAARFAELAVASERERADTPDDASRFAGARMLPA